MFKNLGPPEIGIQLPLDKCIDLARRYGFGGVDVNIQEAAGLVAANGPRHVADLFAEAGLQVGGWALSVDWLLERDDQSFNDFLVALPSLAGIAASVGASRAQTWMKSYSDELPFEQNFERATRRVRDIGKILEEHGQRLAVEPIGPRTFREGHKYEFISNYDGMLRLVNAVDMRNVGLLLDSWHWYTSHGTIPDLKRLANGMIVYVHLSDATRNIEIDDQIDERRRMPGATGVIDNVGLLQVLSQLHYDGPVTAEPYDKEIEALTAEEVAKVTADALSGLWVSAGLSS